MIFIIGGAFQGKTAYVQQEFAEDYVVINHYHKRVKEELKQGKNPMKEAEKLLLKSDHLILISDEIGCGVVPVDAWEREYREQSGRVNCYFAKEAKQVIHVICGIGSRIK